jgi:drug/metabolite transporter (DMT)-like permease
MTVDIGIALALACAFTTNLGFLCKHRGAVAAPTVDIRRPLASAAGLFRSRWFALGMGIAVVAWALHVAAMALAPLSLVQAVIAGGLVWLAVLADRLFGEAVIRRQWIGLALTAAGLAFLALTVPHSSGASSSYSLAPMIAFEGGLVLIGATLVLSVHAEGIHSHHHGILLGGASGVLFGMSDIAIKAATGMSPVEALGSAWAPLALAASVAAFYASARALQKGDAVPVITVTAAAANVSTIAGGIVVFGDPMPSQALGIAAQAVAFALVIGAAILTPAPRRALSA